MLLVRGALVEIMHGHIEVRRIDEEVQKVQGYMITDAKGLYDALDDLRARLWVSRIRGLE